jgi:plastocyanin
MSLMLLILFIPGNTVHGETPEYCSDETGKTVCEISIIPYLEPGDYSPDVAEIPVGSSIVFNNSPTDIHTATSTDATAEDSPLDAAEMVNGIFNTGILNAGETSESILMNESGVFHYYCAVHPDMHGTLIVGDGVETSKGKSSNTPDNSSDSSEKNLKFSTTSSRDTSITGGELPLTKINSVGSEAYIIDGVTPKGGHDAFSYDGSGHKRITGNVQVNLDPITNTGIITAEWTDTEGNNWRYHQTEFAGGNEMYIGETIDGVTQTTLDLDPIAINHYEHGTTAAGPTIEPTLFVYLASWGPAEIFKNDVSQGVFEGHMMVTDGARNIETGKIVQSDGTTPYSPMSPSNSLVNRNTAQLHLVYHTAPAPEMTANFPPPFEVFNHVMFYNLDPFVPVTHVIGTNTYVIDGTTPKGGHDAFSYDGSGHKKTSGQVEVDLDPVKNTGSILAEWVDEEGNNMRLEQTKFAGGNEMYIGETIDGVTQTQLDLDPIAINHFEHGTTAAGPTIEPTLFVYLASWGPAEVFKNGESEGIFETHMMLTEGARDVESGKIFQSDGTTPYSPMSPENSAVNHNTAQLHLVYHTAPAPEMTANFPPPFEVFEHTMFYDIDVLPPTVKPTELKEPKGGHDDKDKTQKQSSASPTGLSHMSPRAQMNQGVDSGDVQCRQGFELIMKNSDASAACIHSQSVEKLIQRGWGSFF